MGRHIYDDGHEISMGTPAERMGLQVLPGVAYGEARPRARRQRLTKLGFVNDETRFRQ